MRQKVYKNIIEFTSCWPTTSGHGTHTEVWLIYPSETPLEKMDFPFSQGPDLWGRNKDPSQNQDYF